MKKITEQRICQVDGCTNILGKTHGRICPKHRTRKFRHGRYDAISPNWNNLRKGQPCLTKLGYIRINIDGKRVLEHRYIMEKHLGRKLAEGERIHHKNGIKTDNRIENLELFGSNGEHMRKCHPQPQDYRQRKTNPSPTEEVVHNIVDRVFLKSNSCETCFCGLPIEARNLCAKHYEWAYSHKLFTPRKRNTNE